MVIRLLQEYCWLYLKREGERIIIGNGEERGEKVGKNGTQRWKEKEQVEIKETEKRNAPLDN